MPIVSITRLRVRSWRYLPVFLLQAFRAALQAKRAPGSLSVTLLQDARKTFWTRTVWKDQQAMRTFMTSGFHRRVMPKLLIWCDEASLVSWPEESDDPPSWSEAHRILLQSGRTSKVSYPSESQRAFQIPPPVSTTRVLRLK